MKLAKYMYGFSVGEEQYAEPPSTIGPINYWIQPKKGNSIVDRKATWPIYNEKFEDLNKYSNGSHSKRLQGEKKLRRILNKKK